LDGPFVNDHDAHVTESAEKEDLLGEPLEEEIYIQFEVNSV
jgi:hypothetical protein